ncbi:MAG: single-stranded-DNA-specific exonuclease RecJ [Proteobacteria bacterium]|nr:single-stranded-DNA-specific exonuclease RecJ [Pseudomonadota bacterium]
MGAEARILAPSTAFGVSRSFSGRRWRLREVADAQARALALAGNISDALARILAGRDVQAEHLEDILNPTLKRLLPEPFSLKDMERAVTRVRAALDASEKIAVYGDYDVDGSSASALLSSFLTTLGHKPRVYIPDRMTEGYGPNANAMRLLAEEGASLVITVDCGATSVDALTAARDAGMDAIVLDHHAVETLPPTYAQVNPNQPGDASGLGYLCATGVTFLFVVALNRQLRDSGWYEANGIAEPDLRDYVDLVGLATVCDVVPLVGVNRAFVRAGLAKLSMLSRPGFSALAAVAKVTAPFTPHHLGFMFGPRINAGGRVGRCTLGMELLSTADAAEAEDIAALLDTHNRERQALEAMILESAAAQAATQGNTPFVLVADEGWHPGVVGIVASRLRERFNKPAFVAGFEGGYGRGSARSIPGIDIGAMVRAAYDGGVLETGGGHAMAAGFSVTPEKLEAFRAFLVSRFDGSSAAFDAANELMLDAFVSPSGASTMLVSELAKAGPYGAGNPEPLLVVMDARVAFASVVGKDHVKLQVAGGDGARLDAIAFRTAQTPLGQAMLAARGKRIHLAGRLKEDNWNGRERVQLQVEDAAPAEA